MLFLKKRKRIRDSNTNNKINMQDIRMEFGIEKYATLIMNRTAKSRKNENARRKWKLQVLGRWKINNKRVSQTNEKASWNQTLQPKSHQRDKNQLWINSRADWAHYPWYSNQSRGKKSLNSKPAAPHWKIDLVSHHTRVWGVV